MEAMAIIESQRKEMHAVIKGLTKTGGLVVTKADEDKTLFLLELLPTIIDLVADYEFSKKHLENGMSQFELVNAEGAARFGEHGQELNKDVTANSVILNEKSQPIYHAYKSLSSIIQNAIGNLRDPHERIIFQMMFVEGKKYIDTSNYVTQGRKDLFAIGKTTMADKRRKGIKRLAASFKLSGVLDVVGVELSEHRRTKNKQYRLLFTE